MSMAYFFTIVISVILSSGCVPKDKNISNTTSSPTEPKKEVIQTKETITDEKTGLMWSRCVYGEVFINDLCMSGSDYGGKTIVSTWADAILNAKNITYAGYNDWRIPTLNEVKTSYQCVKTFANGIALQPGYIPPNKHNSKQPIMRYEYADVKLNGVSFECPSGYSINHVVDFSTNSGVITSTPYPFKKDSLDYKRFVEDSVNTTRVMVPQTGPSSNMDIAERYTKYRFILVRGGNNIEPVDIVEVEKVKAMQEKLRLKLEESKLKEADINTQQKNKYMEILKKNEDATARLRASPKVGDKTSNGLILEVKDNMVLVQTYKTICTAPRANGTCNTFDWKTVTTGNEWVLKKDLSAPF